MSSEAEPPCAGEEPCEAADACADGASRGAAAGCKSTTPARATVARTHARGGGEAGCSLAARSDRADACARGLGFRMLQAAEASREKTAAKRLKTAWLRVD